MKEFSFAVVSVAIIVLAIMTGQNLTDNLHKDTVFVMAFIFGAITSSTVDLIGSRILSGK